MHVRCTKFFVSVGCIARSQGWRVAGPWNRIMTARMARVHNLRLAHGTRCTARVGGATGAEICRDAKNRSSLEGKKTCGDTGEHNLAKNAATLWKAVWLLLSGVCVYCMLADHEEGCTGSHSFPDLCCDDDGTPDPKLLHSVGLNRHTSRMCRTRISARGQGPRLGRRRYTPRGWPRQ